IANCSGTGPVASPGPSSAPGPPRPEQSSISNYQSGYLREAEVISNLPSSALEPVGGAVPLASLFYVDRPTDARFRAALARGDSIVLVKGPRQVGKTSMLARGLQQAREVGARVALVTLQMFTAEQLAATHAAFLTLADLL